MNVRVGGIKLTIEIHMKMFRSVRCSWATVWFPSA